MNLPRVICDKWKAKLEVSRTHRKKVFGDDAEEAMQFYNGPHDFMYRAGYGGRGLLLNGGNGFPTPIFGLTVNKVSELVQLFLPVLYHRNPIRQVNPRVVNVPLDNLTQIMAMLQPQMAQQFAMDMQPNPTTAVLDEVRAKLMEHYLNYTPHELDLREDSRKSIVEALIKGRGVVWTMLTSGSYGRMVGSFYDSVDNLLIDPDAEDLRQATWVARKREEPVWRVERKYGLMEGSLKAQHQSLNQQADELTNEMRLYDNATGKSNDQVTYYEVFSRMGLGSRLSGFDEEARALLSRFETNDGIGYDGDNVYLVIAEGIDYPLNLPPGIGDQPNAIEEIKVRLQWPTPFHHDPINPWPFTELDFHTVPRSPWPMSHIKPAMGYQKFLNWAYSFLLQRMKNAAHTWVAYPSDMEDFADSLKSVNGDFTLIPVDVQQGGRVKEFIEWIQSPPINGDFWNAIAAVISEFEKATGMGELMYGQTQHQYRSAAEADVKQSNLNVRPDYMAERVENWATRIAAKEGLAARYHLDGADIAPVFGEQFTPMDPVAGGPVASGPYTKLWMQLVRVPDIRNAIPELEYRIEAGSARKPNKQRDISNIDESAQVVLPAFMEYYKLTGDPTQLNSWVREWARTRDMNPNLLMFPDLRQAMAMAQAQQMAPQPTEPQPTVPMQPRAA